MSPDDIALFRFHLIAEALSPHLTPAERGWLVRDLASRAHPHPDGGVRAYSRNTFDRWVRAYRERGLDGLRPVKRADSGSVRRHPELIGEAASLRAEVPGRSAAHIAEILFARHRVVVSPRTIRQHLRRRGLARAALVGDRRVFGRYEAERPNERWIGDVLSGPFVPHPRAAGSRKAKLKHPGSVAGGVVRLAHHDHGATLLGSRNPVAAGLPPITLRPSRLPR